MFKAFYKWKEFFKGVSKKDEVVCLTKKTENQLQKITVATSLATKVDKKSEIEPSVPIASATETEMGRKIRDKPELKQAFRAWYESLTKIFDWGGVNQVSWLLNFMLMILFFDFFLSDLEDEYITAGKSSFY